MSDSNKLNPYEARTVEIQPTTEELYSRIDTLVITLNELRSANADVRRHERLSTINAVLQGHSSRGRMITNALVIESLHIANQVIEVLDTDLEQRLEVTVDDTGRDRLAAES